MTAVTEEWNADFAYGVWVTDANLNSARYDLAGSTSGTTTASLAFGGTATEPPTASTLNRII